MAFVEASKVGHKEKGSGCRVRFFVSVSVGVCVCECARLCLSAPRALMGEIEGAGSGRETEILCRSCLYLQASKTE